MSEVIPPSRSDNEYMDAVRLRGALYCIGDICQSWGSRPGPESSPLIDHEIARGVTSGVSTRYLLLSPHIWPSRECVDVG